MKTEPHDNQRDMELTHKQAMKYGQDMAEIYKQERAKREALEVAYKKLEGALESMSDGFLVVDQGLTVIEVNQACADLFEISPHQTIGMPLDALMVSHDTETFCNLLLGMERKKVVHQLEIIMPIERSVVVHAVPLPDSSWVLILHDVTWEERVNNMGEEFLNLAAHELRTPLAGVIGFASLLDQTVDKNALPEDVSMFLNKLLTSTERLRDTVNDLLDFTVSGSQEPTIETVDLNEIIKSAVILLSKQADEQGVTILTELAEMPLMAFGEERMLSVAIGHLIENGIRYNKPNGTLTIETRLANDQYLLIFSDTGLGLTQKDLDYIFKPFFQVEEHTTRKSVGMGLGLSIVQRTIAMHRGSISATSEPGTGSVFQVALPRFSNSDLEEAKGEWLKIQRDVRNRANKNPTIDEQTQNLITTLKKQLEVTQSQSLAYAQDLTKLYQAQRAEAEAVKVQEARITHTDRLALMGQLAAGVAHDLSNLMSPILGYSQMILQNRDAIDPSLVDIIERILNTSRRANILLRQMVNLSSIHDNEREMIALNNLVHETSLLVEIRLHQAKIDLVENYAEHLPEISANAVQISQVVLNVFMNAIEAMDSGGLLTVSTMAQEIEDRPFVQLKISDTGEGILPDILPHIFQAFFTTKAQNSGTGLGLSISKDIIDHHSGQISVESELSIGTTFTISLPVTEAE